MRRLWLRLDLRGRTGALPPPTSDRQLKSYLEEHLYVEGGMRYTPHALQVLTDNDEIELAYYVSMTTTSVSIRARPTTSSTRIGGSRRRAATLRASRRSQPGRCSLVERGPARRISPSSPL